MEEIYSIQNRDAVLEILLKEAEDDTKIGAAIIVGSGSFGFIDEFSDIDLSLIVETQEHTRPAFESWRRLVPEHFSVFEHGAIALKRGQMWKALSDLQDIRQQTIDLHGYRTGFEPKRSGEADKMDKRFLMKLKLTIPTGMNYDPLLKAFHAAVDCFFAEAEHADRSLGLELAPRMEHKMRAYIRKIL